LIEQESFEKCSILFKAKEGEKINHPSTICRTYGAGAGIGQKGAFCKGLDSIGIHNTGYRRKHICPSSIIPARIFTPLHVTDKNHSFLSDLDLFLVISNYWRR